MDDSDSLASTGASSAYLTLWAPQGGGAAALAHRWHNDPQAAPGSQLLPLNSSNR